jgi:glyoxylase-like metal-dependent hydrolase (beta-lactamase superfamily II)
MDIHSWKVESILEGTFGLDGGSMFGIVPKPLWSKRHPTDGQNRITMALRGLLLRSGDRRILVDAGIGDNFNAKQKVLYDQKMSPGGLVGVLAGLGVHPEEITDVIATHLHFDHVGGLVSRNRAGKKSPIFPKAKVFVQEEAWLWAHGASIWDQGSFFGDDFEIWEREMHLMLLQGDCEIAPGVRVEVASGHCPGHQIVQVGEGSGSLVFCADLIPTASHIRLPYIMAYDHQPLQTLEDKKVLLAQALEENWILGFEHDPFLAACQLKEQDGRVLPGEEIRLNP